MGTKMSDDNRNEDRKKNGEFKVPPGRYILWIAILAAVPLLLFFKNNATTQGELLSQAQFEQLVESDQITEGTVIYNPPGTFLNEIAGKYRKPGGPDGKTVETRFKAKVLLYEDLKKKVFASKKFEVKEANTVLLGLLYSVFPILVIGLLIWFIFIRQIKMAGKGALSFGKMPSPCSIASAGFQFARLSANWMLRD
jgi:cell division protease FtsH